MHADARVAPRGKTVFGMAGDGPTGIVGPRCHVKTNSKLTNLNINSRIEGYNGK